MYVCMYVYVYVYIYIYMFLSIYLSVLEVHLPPLPLLPRLALLRPVRRDDVVLLLPPGDLDIFFV